MQVDREGRFKAIVADWSLGETKGDAAKGKSPIPQFCLELHLTMLYHNGEWHPWSDYGHEIRYYGYPFKGTGEPNETTIQALKDSLGWDGMSLGGLQSMDHAGKVVQVTIKSEEYEGKQQFKVGFLNPGDAEPGLRKLSESEVKSIGNKWDAKLRALGGPAKKPSPPAVNGKPTLAPPTPTKRPGADVEAVRAKAWDTFTQAAPADINEADLADKWNSALEELFPGREHGSLAVRDWLLLTDRVGTFFAETPEFADASKAPATVPF